MCNPVSQMRDMGVPSSGLSKVRGFPTFAREKVRGRGTANWQRHAEDRALYLFGDGAANETISVASNYQTSPYPAEHSDARTDQDRLELLSIVRTLPNAPDVYIRFLVVVGSMGYLIRRCHGPGFSGSQESLN
jgi:hypothetical protein